MKPSYLFLADGFEEIEAVATLDILRRADIPVKSVAIGATKHVTGAHHVLVEADLLFDETDFSAVEMLILPGGMPGTSNLNAHEPLKALLKKHHAAEGKIAAVCAAPMVLGGLNILVGEKATCYPGFEDFLIGAEHVEDRAIRSGRIVTGKGPGCTVDFALEIVNYLCGREKAAEVAQGLIA